MRLIALLFFIALWSCRKQADPIVPRLSDYVLERSLAVNDNLIACAASFPIAEVDDNLTNSIFFLPVDGATEFKYFETKQVEDNPDDLNNYYEITLSHEPVFNFLEKFNRSQIQKEVWGKVTYVVADSLHICNAIRLKEPVKPSEINPGLIKTEHGQNSTVKFTWEDGLYPENAIYFQVISNESGDLITGTYTYEKSFTFFDPSNIVLNINPENHSPTLDPGQKYQFTLMAVSIDNWVNLLGSVNFEVE